MAETKDTSNRLCSSCTLTLTQFFLLLGKNFLLQIRRPIGTIFEIFIPIAAVIIIVGFRIGLFTPEDRCFVTFESDPLIIPFMGSYNIYYAPNVTEANVLAGYITPKLASSSGSLIGVETEDNLVQAINEYRNTSDRVKGCFLDGVGIYFNNITGDNIQYSLRFRQKPAPFSSWFTERVSNFFQARGARVLPSSYVNEGFLHLEKIVNEAIIEWKTQQTVDVDVNVQQFPYPEYREDTFLQIIEFILPLFVILSFIYSAGVFVKELVLEKESRIRETMKMMGLSNWILLTTWFIKQLIFYLVPIIIMTLLLRIGDVFPKSNIILVFIYLLLYGISGIAFCFFISVWFSSARIGLMAGFILWFVAYFPYLFIVPYYDTLPIAVKLISCILPNTCVGYGVTVLSSLELRQEGLNFNNFATPISLDDELHMGWIALMLAFDTLVYMLLYWYIDAIKPGKYGVPKPFYFVFLPSFWCNYSSSSKQMAMETMTNLDYNVNAHEEEPVDIPVGISIKNLTKIYNKRSLKKRKVAVDNLSLNMYKGQITALLGHNGAGKTTTMSILTGLFPPTSGTAYINGLSVINDIDLIRRNLGICPQHNVLFDRLTVSEHLKFFARLKGSSSKQLKNEIPQLIDDLLLLDKKNTQSKNLSGGMKRKLSVGIALVGGSEIVILDEPTSGMDPYARRATWDLLAKYKEGRTILLTTHFMDEADLLGDRIAIMAEGKLRCSGSSLFLKSRYGVGYHMTMVKEPHCDSSAVTSLVTSLVAGAQQVTDVGAELSFILPSQASTQFPHLFDILDDKKNELGISSFGISVTTMEEVFIHVGSGADEEDLYLQKSKSSVRDKRRGLEKTPGALETSFHDKNQKDNKIQEIYVNPAHDDVPLDGAGPDVHALPSDTARLSHDDDTVVEIHSPRNSRYGTFNSSQDIKLNTGIILWLQQFRAVFLKRFYNSLRFWVAIIWQFIIPMVFVLWGMILGKSNLSLNVDDPSRSLSLQDTALSSNITFFWADFGGQSSNMFNSEDVGVLGITDFFDFTSDIQSIKDSVRNYNNPNDCCNYQHQFLDKFCNSITLDQLNASGTICPNNDNFGYRPCVSKCLSCCNATSSKIPTCTDPSLQDTSQGSRRIPRTADNYCPFPPSVSIDDQYGQDLPEGPLEGINVYVAEKLLNLSLELEINDFFVRFQGGFVLHPPEPSYSVCSCNNSQVSCGDLGNTLTNWTFSLPPPAIEGISTIPAPFSSLLSSICYNPLLVPPSPSDCGLFNNTDWDYNYDYLTMDCANYGTCSGNGVCNCTGSTQCSTGECGCRIGRTSQPTPPQSNRMAVTVWYNNQPFHMIAAALNSFYNVYLSRTLNSSVTISVTNYPLPRELESQISDAQSDFLGFSISSTAVFGLSFLFASFIIFLVQERYSKAKHLQFVSGVQASSYWLATFSWDLINSLLPSILTVIIFAAFQVEGYTGENIGAVFLLVLLGCWASIPVNYVASFLFSNPLVAFCLMFVFFYFGSVIFQVIVFLLQTDNPDVSETLSYIFLIHPAYALAIGLANMYTNQGIKNACEESDEALRYCESTNVEYANSTFDFASPGIGHIYVYMAVEGLIFIILAILIEREFYVPEVRRLLRRIRVTIDDGPGARFPEEDDDVAEERQRVISTNEYAESDFVVLKNLAKEYKTPIGYVCSCIPKCQEGCKLAVNYINLIIPAGECFGLLGVNGAGKTTTFKMLTGDITPTSGNAILNGYNIRTQLRQVQQRIGYCPQFDALIERLTGKELLTMFARLRGIPEKYIKDIVQNEIGRLDLAKYANKLCGTYSGGNKRKLSTAISLVGNPSIVLLDEPTTGMDPATRRFLWDVLMGVVKEGRSVVLTSHSMEECEALCTRLAIMVNGTFKCLGSIQHLKSKFGSGYTLQIKVLPRRPENAVEHSTSLLKRSSSRVGRGLSPVPSLPRSQVGVAHFDTSEVELFITETFPGSQLLERHQGCVTYQIPSEGVTWSILFRTVEDNKEHFGIIDYSVSQPTLDQVFITFAQEQEEAEN